MFDLRIRNVVFEGMAHVVSPYSDPSELVGARWGDMTEPGLVSCNGPAIVINPLLDPETIAKLARNLGPTVTARLFSLPALGPMLPNTVIPIGSEEKGAGTALLDQISIDGLVDTPHFINGKTATHYLS